MRKETIKLLRTSHGLNREQFAAKVGISRPLVVGIEDGWRKITPRTLRRVTVAFGLTAEDIIEIERLQARINKVSVS